MKKVVIILSLLSLVAVFAMVYRSEYGPYLHLRSPQNYDECLSAGGQIIKTNEKIWDTSCNFKGQKFYFEIKM